MEIPTVEITNLTFYVLGDKDNELDSQIEVKSKELFKDTMPYPNGVYDLRMGTSRYNLRCKSCKNVKDNCPGHVGSFKLPYPVINPYFKAELVKWLKIICFSCGLPIISPKIGAINSGTLNEYIKNIRNVSSSKDINCINCGAQHPIIIKYAKDYFKIFARYSTDDERILDNYEIEHILSKITNETVLKLGKSLDSHPNKFTLRTIRIPPITIRPDIQKMKGGRSNNNDLTTIVKNIVETAEKLPKVLTHDMAKSKEIIKELETIELHYHTLIKDVPPSSGVRLQSATGASLISTSARLTGKTGRVRRNLMGKRVFHMARSVIVGDNILKIDEVGVPMSIARNIQIPEVVRYYNKDRLTVYFLNKNKAYPGCSKIIKGNTGIEYFVNNIKDDIILEDGDTLYRDLIDGDDVAANRAPSLLYSSISGLKARIMSVGDTFRFSANIVDTLFGGDFDGDAMQLIFPHSIMASNECRMLCSLKRWFISYKDGSPAIGIYHDGVIGISEFTADENIMNKYYAMHLLGQIDDYSILNTVKFEKQITGRDMIGMLLPPINYVRKSGHYNPDYNEFIQYKKNEIKVEINRGNVITGKFDKKIIGQGVNGSIFHIIHNEYGATEALNIINNTQQITTLFQMHNGFTINCDDITANEKTYAIIKEQLSSVMLESELITENLKSGTMVPPIGMTLKEYYEQLQLASLQLGDQFLKPILNHMDPKNNLYKIISSGSKGKPTNFTQVNASIGQTSIGGSRMGTLFSFGRTLPYFERFSTSPQSRGFVVESYTTGVQMSSFVFQAMEARYGIINKALSTSITGHQNRKSIKNLETLKVDNLRKLTKGNNIVQFLYGEDGIDIRFTEIVKFNTILTSNTEFTNEYKCDVSKFDKMFNNKEVIKMIEDEFTQLSNDRIEYRRVFLKIERQNNIHKLISDTQNSPINMYRIIEDTLYNCKEYLSETKIFIDPIKSITKVNQLIKNLEYCHYNEIYRNANRDIPKFISTSMMLNNILIRSYLCLNNIVKRNIDEKILNIIINRILITFGKALIEPGLPIGIITAQCISEPLTQNVLDSLHRTGSSGTKVDFLVRAKEIFGVKETAKMQMPLMTLYVNEKYNTDKFQVQNIANHIETNNLQMFVMSYSIFFEDYKEIIHPDYIHENNLISLFEKHNPNMFVPNNLIKWCIRLEFNKEMLMEKNLKFEDICIKINELYPLLHIVFTNENSVNILMRIYIRNTFFKKSEIINIHTIEKFITTTLLKSTIRGVENIMSTTVDKIIRSVELDDGSIGKKDVLIISTVGTNMTDIIYNPYIDPYLSQSNSIVEMQSLFGIEAARNKIVIEMRNMMPGVSDKHYGVFADEMTTTGQVTSIEKGGIDQREKNNVLLQISNSHIIQYLENAAINNVTSSTTVGLSPSLMVGSTPSLCSNFNDVLIDEEYLKNNIVNMNNISDSL